jgi:alkylated DNA repair protein (DNA oxidative demethylase)
VDELGLIITPHTCLVNFYPAKSGKLGLHQDNSEFNQKPPIISISLGNDAVFLLGGKNRNDKTEEIILKSGDVIVLSGESRLAFHGIKKVIPNTSNILKQDGRINLTIRQVW